MEQILRWIGYAAVVASTVFQPNFVHAGTTVIQIESEGAGNIVDETNGTVNLNGAMVWNGSGWVVNNTWTHRYFVNQQTGERLKNYDSRTRTYTGITPLTDTYGNYNITGNLYSYDKPAEDGSGMFRETGMQYTITEATTSQQIILLSRGLGLGTGASYFDVYIEEMLSSGSFETTALIGDPIWFQYSGRAVDAIVLDPSSLSRRGNLAGALTTQGTYAGDYYLDIGGGSDLGPAGQGRSYNLITSSMNPDEALTQNLLSSFTIGFNLKYMDSGGELHMLSFSPGLANEQFIGNPPAPVPEPSTVILFGCGLALLAANRRHRS